jgi:hypothetical protein
MTIYPWVVLGLVVAVAAIVIAVSKRQIASDERRRTATPRGSCASAIAGQRTRIIGTVRPHGRTLVSPHSGTQCVAFQSAIFLHGGYRGPSSPPERREIVPFSVVDETGEIDVEVSSVELDVVADTHARPFGADVIDRHSGSDGHATYYEQVLAVGASVAVIGTVKRGVDGNLMLTASADDPVVISNFSSALGA